VKALQKRWNPCVSWRNPWSHQQAKRRTSPVPHSGQATTNSIAETSAQ
jgi:hypothetical protein